MAKVSSYIIFIYYSSNKMSLPANNPHTRTPQTEKKISRHVVFVISSLAAFV